MGWRLLYSPWRTTQSASVAFIGLNPGGDESNTDHGEIDTVGSAYESEDWSTAKHTYSPGKSPLQLQVRKLFGMLGVNASDVLAGNLVPFRSPSWKSLPRRDEAISFGAELWRALITHANPRLIVVMSQEPWEALLRDWKIANIESKGINWGSYQIRRGNWEGTKVVALPHLSRFRIMERSKSEDAVSWAFGEYVASQTKS
jgi:uracil-DNA glycosylase